MTYLPDKLHLHSLIYSKINLAFPINKNSLTGLIINIALIPNFIVTYLFYNQSFYLGISVIIYITFYVVSYFLLIKNNLK